MQNSGLDANYIANLKAHTRDVLKNPSLGITPLDIISAWTQRDVVWTPGSDIHAFARRFGPQAPAIRAVLETWQQVLTSPAHASVPQAVPAPPLPRQRKRRSQHTAAPPPPFVPPALIPGPEMLCACSDKLPEHAMLGEDGRLYDRDKVASLRPRLRMRPNHTMTGAINAWREHSKASPTQRAAAMRSAVQCPITMEVPEHPVLAADGYTYERSAIAEHLRRNGEAACSPMLGVPLASHDLVDNASLRRLIAAQEIAEASN